MIPNCKEKLKPNSLKGEWVKQGDNGIFHDFKRTLTDETGNSWKECVNCDAKEYPYDGFWS